MPDRIVRLDGVEHHFPADATDEEITKALGGSQAPEQPSALSRAGVGVLRTFHPLDALTGAVSGVVGAVAHPIDTLKGIGQGVANESERLNTLAREGNEGSALNWVPFVGPQLAHAADTIRGGNVAGGLGEAAGIVGTAETVPRVLSGTGRVLNYVAPEVMATALRIPAPLARKYGRRNLGERAIKDLIVPGTAGASDEAQGLVNARMAEEARMLAGADQRASIAAPSLAAQAEQELAPKMRIGMKSGVRPSGATPALLQDFAKANPQGMTPSELNAVIADWNDVSDAARRSIPTGGRIGVDERAPMILARMGNEAIEQIAPGYRDLNRKIMMTTGVQLAAKGREDIPAGGLENLAASHEIAASLANSNPKVAMAVAGTRLARMPPALGVGAIGADMLGNFLKSVGGGRTGDLIRAAILAKLSQQGPQP